MFHHHKTWSLPQTRRMVMAGIAKRMEERPDPLRDASRSTKGNRGKSVDVDVEYGPHDKHSVHLFGPGKGGHLKSLFGEFVYLHKTRTGGTRVNLNVPGKLSKSGVDGRQSHPEACLTCEPHVLLEHMR